MNRSSAFLPVGAELAGFDLVDRADRGRKKVEERLDALREKRRGVSNGAHEVQRKYWAAKNDALERARWERAGKSEGGALAEIAERLQKRLDVLDADDARAGVDLEEKLQALEAEKEELEGLLDQARRRAKSLRAEQTSYLGLAPWDSVALEAYRAWGKLPGLPEDPPCHMLKGSEVEALFHERLGVSRSTYYAEYRGLLRLYHLTPFRTIHLADGGIALPPRRVRRFRLEEVEHLVRFLLREEG